MLAITLATLLTGASLFQSFEVEAAPTKAVRGEGIGAVTCPDGTQLTDIPTGFEATKDQKQLSGSFFAGFPRTFLFLRGDIDAQLGDSQTQITKNKYTLVGTQDLDDMCGTNSPTSVLIKGLCGENVKIEFTTRNGVQGEFTGNVVCLI